MLPAQGRGGVSSPLAFGDNRESETPATSHLDRAPCRVGGECFAPNGRAGSFFLLRDCREVFADGFVADERSVSLYASERHVDDTSSVAWLLVFLSAV